MGWSNTRPHFVSRARKSASIHVRAAPSTTWPLTVPDAVSETLRAAFADRYDIERELGHGGMATVYLARDRKHDRRVALKVLRPDLVSTLGTARFLREIAIAAHLAHPHILTLIDSGVTATGDFLYYVMPVAEGESLRERLTRDGPLALPEAIRLLRESTSGSPATCSGAM